MRPPFDQWLKERCVVEDDARTPAAELYADYSLWCGRRGLIPERQKAFGWRMSDHMLVLAGKDGQGRQIRAGVRLRRADEPASTGLLGFVAGIVRSLRGEPAGAIRGRAE